MKGTLSRSAWINILMFMISLFFPFRGIAGPMPAAMLKSLSMEIASSVAEVSRGDALPDEHLSQLAGRFYEIDNIMQDDESMVPVDLSWVSGNLDTIRNEPDLRRRRQMLLQWRDTLRLIEEDVSAKSRGDRATRQEMEEALKRAEHVTSLPDGCLWEYGSGDGSEGGTPLYESIVIGQTIPVPSGSSGGSSGSSISGSGGGFGSSSMPNSRTQDNLRPVGQSSRESTTQASRTTVSGKTPPPQYQPPKPPPKPRMKPPSPPSPKPSSGGTSWVQTLLKVLYWVIVALCIIAFAIVLWVILQTWRQRVTGDDSSQLLGITPLPEVRKQAQTLFRQAEEAAAANNLQEALRLIMTACLLLLEERSVLAFQECLTNGEYLGRLAERRQLQDIFKEPLQRFDGIVYGFNQPMRSDYDSFCEVFRKLGGAA